MHYTQLIPGMLIRHKNFSRDWIVDEFNHNKSCGKYATAFLKDTNGNTGYTMLEHGFILLNNIERSEV